VLITEFDELRRTVRGPVMDPEDPAAVPELSGYNLAAEHHPVAVVGATDAADVAATVRFAADRGLPVAVQATGHGTCVDEGAVLISTRRLDEVSVYPDQRRARVGSGARWRDVITAAAPHGLATLNGSSSDSGVVGYTLGGGSGPLVRTFGFAADHVRSLDVVTADGRLRRVAPDQQPDLFAGLLGSKGNLGVVTAMEFDLLPLPTLYGGLLVAPAEDAADLLHAYCDWAPGLPEQTTTSIGLLRLPALDIVPEPLRDRLTVHLRVAHVGPAEEGERLLAPVRAVTTPVMDAVAEMPFSAIDSIYQDPPVPLPFWETGTHLAEFGHDAADALLEVAGPGRDVPLAIVAVRHVAGAAQRNLGNCVGGRSAPWVVEAIGLMPPPLRDVVPGAGRAVLQALAPWSTGVVPVNFISPDLDPPAPGLAWELEIRDRLRELKARYDPHGMFRSGYGIE
jgi:FAD/FMN-containing dehydrogenase